MNYRSYGHDTSGKWIDNRKSRKTERKLVLTHNRALHGGRAKRKKETTNND